MDSKFRAVYNKFAAAYRARKYNEVIKLMGTYKCDAISQTVIQHHVYLVRSTFDSWRRCPNEAAPQDVTSIVNYFETVLAAIANIEGCQQFLSTLNTLAHPDYLNVDRSLLAIAADGGADMERWMRSIGKHLVQAFSKATDADDKKALFLALTQSALIFFKLESDLSGTRFTETKHYLDCCIKLEFLRSDKHAADFVKCFNTMKNCAKTWENEADWQKNMDEIYAFVYHAPKTLRATAVQDIAVTLTEFIQITKRKICLAPTCDRIRILFKLLSRLMDILRHTKYDKTFCNYCKTNVGPHEVEVAASVAIEVYKSAIQKNIVLDAQIYDSFGKMFATNLMNLSKLDCSSTNYSQSKHLQELRQMTTLCSSTAKMNYVIPVYTHIFQNFADIQLNKVKLTPAGTVDELYMLRKLYDFVKSAEMWSELIHVGFFMLAYILVAEKPNKILLHSTIYEVSKIQVQYKDTIPFETPYDFYTRKKDSVFRVKFPENVSVVDMLLAYVENHGKYSQNGLDELNNKCIYQLMMLAAKEDPIHCMRFIYHIDKFNYESTVAERCKRHLRTFRASVELYDEKKKRAALLLIGAFNFHNYMINMIETNKKNAGLVLQDELNSTDRPTIFSLQTLAFEREQAELLFAAKKQMESFLIFCMELNEADRAVYEEELRYLLKAMKDVARYFQARDYECESMEAFVALYRLAKLLDDQFGMINACSYIAENSLAFRERFRNQHELELTTMLDQCYVLLVKNIQDIATLSIRKQKEIFYCLLNIALYHFADNRIDDGKKIMQFVRIQMQERNIHHGVVEMKYYSVLFEMISKYQQPSRFSAIEFGEYLIKKIRDQVANLPPEDATHIPMLMFNAIPAIVTFLLNRYESTSSVRENLLQTMLKLAVKSGYVRRSTSALILIGVSDLYQEKWQMAEKRIEYLDQICQIGRSGFAAPLINTKLSVESATTVDCMDPIRRDASTTHCLSPYKVITNNIESHMCSYLPSHTKNCSCDICHDGYNRVTLFKIGSLYARTTYMNETDVATKQSIQSEIYTHWLNNLKASESSASNDNFIMAQVRMLVWSAHTQWKFVKNRHQAKDMLEESVELLRKVQHYDRAVEHDLVGQIELLYSEIMLSDSTGSNFSALNSKSFLNKGSPRANSKIQPVAATKAANRPAIHIFEGPATENRPKPVKFQIHDDDSPETAQKATKKAKKTRSQKDIKTDEISIVDLTSPTTTKEPSVIERTPIPESSKPKPVARPNHVKAAAILSGDAEAMVQPTRKTRKRAEKLDEESVPVTRPTRSRRERK